VIPGPTTRPPAATLDKATEERVISRGNRTAPREEEDDGRHRRRVLLSRRHGLAPMMIRVGRTISSARTTPRTLPPPPVRRERFPTSREEGVSTIVIILAQSTAEAGKAVGGPAKVGAEADDMAPPPVVLAGVDSPGERRRPNRRCEAIEERLSWQISST
jgi:hypothetical protein